MTNINEGEINGKKMLEILVQLVLLIHEGDDFKWIFLDVY